MMMIVSEKAHPSVWNTFLQVFDAGRLTDGRGVTATFAETIIIMTSNIGVREANQRVLGFGGSVGDAAGNAANKERQLAAIKEVMAPELVNRLDEVVLFNALSPDAIRDIARVELASTTGRLGAAGWSIQYDDTVVEWLATTGYDPAFGARHLMRNIEREFLALVARAGNRKIKVTVDGAHLGAG
jgi:ATP-dependent Clp protease ATP-binding subunit ClpC